MTQSPDQELYRFDSNGALLGTNLPFPKRSGKVRDVYDLGNNLLIVSTDRISAFDYILPSGIPEKGRLLTAMSEFWFQLLGVRHHLISTEILPSFSSQFDTEPLRGRIMLTEKASVVPFECVVRGYLEGSGLREYQSTGAICGNSLPANLVQCDRLPEPIFTPATKAEEGHDENVSIDRMIEDLLAAIYKDGDALLDEEERRCLKLAIEALRELRETTTEHRLLARQIESVAKASEEFAARRMDASIKAALAGQSLDDIDKG